MSTFKSDAIMAFVVALRCKHCEEFYSNKKDVHSISENEACRECDAGEGMNKEVEDTF